MEVWPSEFGVAQAWCLKGTIHGNAVERAQHGPAWLAHTIGIGICADRSPPIFVLSGYGCVAEDWQVHLGNTEAVEQRLPSERQRLAEGIRTTTADVVCCRCHSNVVKAVVGKRA